MIGILGSVAIIENIYPAFAIKNGGLLKFNGNRLLAEWFYYPLTSFDYNKYHNFNAIIIINIV